MLPSTALKAKKANYHHSVNSLISFSLENPKNENNEKIEKNVVFCKHPGNQNETPETGNQTKTEEQIQKRVSVILLCT